MNQLSVFLFSLCIAITFNVHSQPPESYIIYNSEGHVVKWKTLVKEALKSKVVFFGEEHDNSIGHWLQYELAEELLSVDTTRQLGAEMFEFDQQGIIDEYLRGFILQSSFEEDARLWENYQDYKPLVELAKSKSRNFIATNIPRRYARTVYYYGQDTLEEIIDMYDEFLPDIPIAIDTTLESYKLLSSGMGAHGTSDKHLLAAQAIKDAVMAHNICESLRNKRTILHFNGRYHSDKREGIVFYTQKYCNPSIMTISMTSSENCDFPEKMKQIADFIIITNQNISKSYE